jgi:prepilin-type N-terminal cleavage/methylation domain-containing protein
VPPSRKRPRAAFTLAEVVAAITIVAIVSAATIPTIRGRLQVGEANAIVDEFFSLKNSILSYKQDVGRFPFSLAYLSAIPASNVKDGCNTTADTLSTSQALGWNGPYVDRSISGDFVIGAGDTVRSAIPTLSTSSTIQIQIAGVDSGVANLVDQEIDGSLGNTTGQLLWAPSGQLTVLTYNVPFHNGSC